MASDEENAEFRGKLRAHMENTASGIKEIKEDAQRQTEATNELCKEVTLGFGKMDTRVSLVESAHQAQVERCDDRLETLEAGRGGNPKRTAAAAGGGAGISLILREIWESFFKGGIS